MKEIKDNDRKCALYVRVSTNIQVEEGESLEEQVKRLENFCKFKGWKNYRIYREEGWSGKDTKRPEFLRMMRDIHRGEINTVIVKRIDRLSRSIIDFENIYRVFEEKGVDLISLQENFDTSTALGRGVIRIVLVFAQLEREQAAERTTDIMAFRAREGLFNGGYPRLGYDIDYENKRLVPNESEIPIVREAFEKYYEFGSLSKTAQYLNLKGYRTKRWISKKGIIHGGRKFTKNSVSRLLRDPIYAGKIRYKGIIYQGKHEAIVDKDLFNAVQSILNANNMTKTGFREGTDVFLLKGLVRCGSCRSMMSPSYSTSKGRKYYYYRCTVDNDRSKNQCRIGSVRAGLLEELVVEELKFLTKDPRIIAGVVDKATEGQKREVKELNRQKNALMKKLSRIDRQAKNITDVISDEGRKGKQLNYLLEKLKELEEESENLKNHIEQIEFEIESKENRIISAEIIQENLRVFKDVYDQLTPEEKYDLLHLLIKRVTYYEEQEEREIKKGKIKIDLWELPSTGPNYSNSARSFAESIDWLPG